jgi:hypothetical protein
MSTQPAGPAPWHTCLHRANHMLRIRLQYRFMSAVHTAHPANCCSEQIPFPKARIQQFVRACASNCVLIKDSNGGVHNNCRASRSPKAPATQPGTSQAPRTVRDLTLPAADALVMAALTTADTIQATTRMKTPKLWSDTHGIARPLVPQLSGKHTSLLHSVAQWSPALANGHHPRPWRLRAPSLRQAAFPDDGVASRMLVRARVVCQRHRSINPCGVNFPPPHTD